jgi:hypothetical protein
MYGAVRYITFRQQFPSTFFEGREIRPMPSKGDPISVYLPKGMGEILRARAADDGRTVSNYVLRLIEKDLSETIVHSLEEAPATLEKVTDLLSMSRSDSPAKASHSGQPQPPQTARRRKRQRRDPSSA